MRFMWAFPPTGSPGASYPLYGSPAADAQGRILLCVHNRLFALNAAGAVLWQVETGGYIPGSPVVGPDGNIRVHSSDGSLHAFTGAGARCWPPAPVGPALGWATPLVDTAGNTWVSSFHGGLLRVDARGACYQHYQSERPLNSSGAIVGAVLFIGGEDGFVHAVSLDGTQGRNLWDHGVGRGKTGWFINSALAVRRDGAIVVASRDNVLYAFNPDGSIAWKVGVPMLLHSSPVLDPDDNIYVAVSESPRGEKSRGRLLCIDGRTRKLRWKYPKHGGIGAVESTPAIGSDGMIYFGDNAGTIYAVDRDGQAQGVAPIGSAVRSAGALVAPNRLAFGIDGGRLLVFECPSPAPAGGWPKLLGNERQSAYSSV